MEDAPAVIELWNKCFKNDPPWNDPASIIKRKSAYQPDLFLVGKQSSKVIATVIGGYDGFRGWVYHLAVDPELRSKGYGQLMMTAIEKKLYKLGCIKINLQIRMGNREVINFYESIGYKIEDHTSMGKLLKHY